MSEAYRLPLGAVTFVRAPGYDTSVLTVETEVEEDGRWIAEVPALPGVMAYGASREDAVRAAQVIALRVVADRIEHGEPLPELVRRAFSVAA